VYTKLLAVLGKAGRPKEALQIFKLMRVRALFSTLRLVFNCFWNVS